MEKVVGGSISVICGSLLIKGKKNLCEIEKAVNELYRLNSALRIHIEETDGVVFQTVSEYTEQKFKVLCFNDKTELNSYAEKYAKIPLDFYGNLCEINIITLPEQYGLLIKLHHIIGDAWTLSLLGTQFNKLTNGEMVEAFSYADYVESENTYIQSKRYEKDKAFFIEQFKKCDEVTYINEKQSDSLNASRKTFVIDKSIANNIKTYAAENNTSAFMLFTAALATYINRTKMNAENFYIGTAVLNRNGVKEQNTAGMFVNTVPMLIQLDNNKSFAENLSSVENTAFSVFRHQKFNYGDVLSEIRKEYSFSEKLYDVMISYQNATVMGKDVETVWYHSGMQSESLQIHIDDRDNEGIYRIHYDYLTEKFSENEIEKLHGHICNLLFDAMSDSSKKLYEINILSADEKQKILYDFNNTAADYPRDKCVHQLFEEQVEKTPDKVAVIACDKTLTYQELNKEANRIAHSLIAKGILKNDIIAFQISRKSYLISLMFGILKCGASYMPIDPNYPKDRVEYMVNDIGAKFCVTDELVQELLCNDKSDNLNIYNSPQDYFCVLHTSGSTGLPKGAAIKHNNMVNFIFSNLYLVDKIDNVIAINTVTFDVFEMDTIFPLVAGVTCIVADEEQQFNQVAFESMMKKYKNCLFWATPTKMSNYINNSSSGDFFESINCYVVGGEILKPELLDTIRKLNKNIKIYTVYGPTETLIYSTLVDVSKTNDISIGHPISNTQIYIVDKYMKPTPIGVTGELCIAGDGVGAGYLNRPELTAEKFIDNPFGEGKLYKTGDLTYWREDGNIAYVGRNDFQVKIRGLRIELGEIENAICSIDKISQAVAVVRKNNEGRQLICAFYTGVKVDVKEIRNHIGKKLPKYMLPHIFVYLDKMPLTASGKINRKALPEISLNNLQKKEYTAPKTNLEKVIVSAVESILGVEKVSVTDNFFDVGGDSLKAIELISKLEKSGYHIDSKTIFECDNIKELAKNLTTAKAVQEVFDYDGDIPATEAQLRIYMAHSMNADNMTYNVPYVFTVDNVDINRLQNAINKLIARHESLRTHFENKNGNIIQVINVSAECTVENLSSDNINDFVRPFNLNIAPLLRVGVYKNTVMVDMHHIITDGSSMVVFFKELNTLYTEKCLNESPIQYKQFALEQKDYTQSKEYWQTVFDGEFSQLKIDTDFEPLKSHTYNGNVIYDHVNLELNKNIVSFCGSINITPFVFYMSAFNILLSKISGSNDIVVGMPISGRNSKYLNTIGMFVNTIPLRNRPLPQKSVNEFLLEVKSNTVSAIQYQDYPYREILKIANKSGKVKSLFNVVMAYESAEMTEFSFDDKTVALKQVPLKNSKFDLTLYVLPTAEKIVLMMEYSTDLFLKKTIENLLCEYKSILETVLKNNNMKLSDIIRFENKINYAVIDVGLEDVVYIPPETQLQKKLCELVEAVLNLKQVGIIDDFFDLGGDSLKAIELISKAHNEGIYFNLQNVFDYPTVKELCEYIENGDKQNVSFADVDFTTVNKVLEKNQIQYIAKPQKSNVGNILLAGATGYLGMHILADFLDNDSGIAYCLVRGNNITESQNRLNKLLEFYFGEKYSNSERIKVICADLQKDKLGLNDGEYQDLLSNVTTVINCAASVKHYGSYKYFYEANVETVKHLISFCRNCNAKLIHTSTLSVSGNSFGDTFDGVASEKELHFYESSLYIDQPLDNVYARSKFEAEKAVLEAMSDGLQANIMRMGNLTNRLSDGKFQKNHESNAFLQRVKGVTELGMFPDYLIKDTNYAEFTPIDEAANAVMTIARHFSTEQTVFHINSIKVVHFDKLFKYLKETDTNIDIVDGNTFTLALRKTAEQTGSEYIFETFINDMDENEQLNYDGNIRIENDFTVQYLKNLGFEWSDIGLDYLQKYIKYFRKIGYLR